MKIVTLTFTITIRASQRTIFDYISNWEKQSDWIMFTTVSRLSDSAIQQDLNLLAITKIGPVRLVDTMVVTDWQPFNRIVIEHTGRIVLGKGIFSVQKVSNDSCKFVWQEITPVPFGLIGQIGLAIFKPIINVPFNMSLKRLKSNIESAESNGGIVSIHK